MATVGRCGGIFNVSRRVASLGGYVAVLQCESLSITSVGGCVEVTSG